MKRSSGLTLLELLVAMSLLAALGGFIAQLMRSSFDLYREGEKRGDVGVNANVVLDLLADDLANVAHGPDGRFVLQRMKMSTPTAQPFVRLVRTIPGGDAEHRVLRLAGTQSKPEDTWTGPEPGPDSRTSIKPASGVMEVCYALLQEEADDPGVLTLYRGVRAPAHEPGGFFDAGGEEGVQHDEVWVRQNLIPLATGVLNLDILCWGPGTQEWGRPSRGARSGSAYETWESTRGTPADGRDDLYPGRVRITLVIARPGRPDARLARRAGPADTAILVDDADRMPLPDDPNQDVSVGGEWMTITKREGHSFGVARGGAGVAQGGASEAGSAVYVGRRYERTVNLPDPRPVYDGGGG